MNSQASPFLIENVRLIDPASNLDAIGYLLAEDSKIVACKKGSAPEDLGDGVERVDGTGKVLFPGLVDMHVRVGEPGDEHKETIASAGQAAAAGGITSILMLPTTNPVIDDIALVEFLQRRSQSECAVKLYPSAALTTGMQAKEMSEIGLLSGAGAKAFYHGPDSIVDNVLLKRTLTYARDFDALTMLEVNDTALGTGDMNAGEEAAQLGLSGIPVEAEIIPLERDMRIVAMTNAKYHAAQISTAESIEIIRAAKARSLKVTCAVSINNLSLLDKDIGAYRTHLKLSPPLRGEEDRAALIAGVVDGTIDAIVSAHDPHDVDTKRHPFGDATPGAVGLETMLPAALELVHAGALSLLDLANAMSFRPAQILGLDAGTLSVGAAADFCLIDLDDGFTVTPESLKSKAKNTPFKDTQFKGRAIVTWVDGVEVFRAEIE